MGITRFQPVPGQHILPSDPRAEQDLAQPLIWVCRGAQPGEGSNLAESLCHSVCQPCLPLELKFHLLTCSLVLLLPAHPAVPSAMEVLVPAQAPRPPPDPWGLVHHWMGSRCTTQRTFLAAPVLCVHVGLLCMCQPSGWALPAPQPALRLLMCISLSSLSCSFSWLVLGSGIAVPAFPQHTSAEFLP